ncbi:MAG: hypothetical protein HUU20_07900 [Pirellulales bacterium]|nr:hypothetical protein [Pirellulales bacterium]
MKASPENPRADRLGLVANGRAWNIAFRTAHIASMGVLLGGHSFDVSPSRLLVALWLTVGTGAALVALEAGPSLLWFHQGRGLMTMAKLALLLLVPLFWEYRLPILLVVVGVASVGSHMPARYRYYSIFYREVLRCHGGPGDARLAAESADNEDRGPEDPS